MSIASPKAVIRYLFASILVGTVLGVSGAFAAQGFRSGIIFVSDFLKRIYQGEPNFFFYLFTLSIALLFVHYSKVFIKGKPFQVLLIVSTLPISQIMKQM